ncbi:transposase [Streptomyces sp. NBC_01235]|uniref:transposase n=1 Tax=Streptomyces sp. NBC_01235 TaxID=2903788 RepID=UPI002E103A2F
MAERGHINVAEPQDSCHRRTANSWPGHAALAAQGTAAKSTWAPHRPQQHDRHQCPDELPTLPSGLDKGALPADDVAEVTAAQVRRVVEDHIDMGRRHAGDRDILIVFDAGYDAPRMAYLLEGLPVAVLGRMRTDRVMRKPVPVPWISPPQGGRPASRPSRPTGRPAGR